MDTIKRIGVDLGGTNVRCGLLQSERLHRIDELELIKKDDEQAVIDQIASLILQSFTDDVETIGIGVPSVVDAEKGIVYDTVNIPSWKEVHLKEKLEGIFKIPVSVNNDANCFVLGEKFFGKATKHSNVVGLTLGTGVGGGIIIGDRLYNGNNCGAGEFGAAPFRDSDFEHYCSGMFFNNFYQTSAKDAYKAACSKNENALNQYCEFGDNISYLIQNVLYTIDPEMIVFGGSLSKAFEFFSASMYAGLSRFVFKNSLERVKIEVSELDNAGIMGAAMLGLEYQK